MHFRSFDFEQLLGNELKFKMWVVNTIRMSVEFLFTVFMGSMIFNNFMCMLLTLYMAMVLLSFVSASAVLTYKFNDLMWW